MRRAARIARRYRASLSRRAARPARAGSPHPQFGPYAPPGQADGREGRNEAEPEGDPVLRRVPARRAADHPEIDADERAGQHAEDGRDEKGPRAHVGDGEDVVLGVEGDEGAEAHQRQQLPAALADRLDGGLHGRPPLDQGADPVLQQGAPRRECEHRAERGGGENDRQRPPAEGDARRDGEGRAGHDEERRDDEEGREGDGPVGAEPLRPRLEGREPGIDGEEVPSGQGGRDGEPGRQPVSGFVARHADPPRGRSTTRSQGPARTACIRAVARSAQPGAAHAGRARGGTAAGKRKRRG